NLSGIRINLSFLEAVPNPDYDQIVAYKLWHPPSGVMAKTYKFVFPLLIKALKLDSPENRC
ncbi:MAG: hypothetical protein WCI18_17365, partial [Pseudomonadota bacterium]